MLGEQALLVQRGGLHDEDVAHRVPHDTGRNRAQELALARPQPTVADDDEVRGTAAACAHPPGVVPDESQRTADELIQVIKEELGEEPPVLVQPRVMQGRPAKVLIEESANADLLVVGKRGHGGFAGLVLGSVSQHVAAYAKCPVAVVR